MTSRRGSWLLPTALVLSGVTVGGMAVFLATVATRNWTAEWVETAGTWFGGIGTILTLAWAIIVFRTEQDRRAQAQEDALRDNASMFDVTVTATSTHSSGGEQLLEDVKVQLVNDSSAPVRILRLGFPSLTVTRAPRLPIRLSPGESVEQRVEFTPFPITSNQLNTGAISALEWTMEFESSGVRWKKDASSMQRVEGTASHPG